MLDRTKLEEALAALPIFQYAYFSPTDLVFTERVRHVCETECPMYGKTWACPPAVGTVEACRARCLSYPEGLMISTVTEVGDVENLEETLSTRKEHEDITHQVAKLVQAQGLETYVLSTEACALCEKCAYPDAPCRHPDKMFPCVESHGILVTDLCEKQGMEFFNGNIVTWFSLILYRRSTP